MISSGTGLARDLAQLASEPIFDITRLVEAARHQRLASHPAPNSTARWQVGVDETYGVGDSPFVELGDTGRQRIYERVQLGAGHARLTQP